MKIVVIGGTGLIGSKVVEKLKHKGPRQLQRRQIRASTRLRAKAWQMRLRVRPLSLVRNDDLTVARVDHEDGGSGEVGRWMTD